MADKTDAAIGGKKASKAKKPPKRGGAGAPAGGNAQASKGGGLGGVLFAAVSLIAALFIIAVVLGGALFFVIKTNLLGVADTYRDQISRVPILSLALPKVINPDDPATLSREDLLAAYSALEEERDAALARVAEVESERDAALAEAASLRTYKDQAEAQQLVHQQEQAGIDQQRAQLDADRKAFEDLKYEAETAAAEGNPEAYAAFFEGVNPEVAQEIYAQVAAANLATQEMEDFAKLYGDMDAKSAAAIFEQMGDSRLDLIVSTLRGMKRDQATEIIASMTPAFAASVSVRMAAA